MEIDTCKWKKFKIGNLFILKRGSRIVRDQDYFDERNEELIYPVITATTMNNGIDGWYNNFNSDGNVICCCGDASGMFSTYQKTKFWAVDTVRILKPKFNMNEHIALFLVTILKQNMFRYSYGRKANVNDISKIHIKLPSTSNGEPDWEWMENYIKTLLERERERVLNLFKNALI